MNKIWLFLYFNVAFISNAYAYLDPGTGNLIIQGLIAGGLSVTLFVKAYWYRITSYFKNKNDKEDN